LLPREKKHRQRRRGGKRDGKEKKRPERLVAEQVFVGRKEKKGKPAQRLHRFGGRREPRKMAAPANLKGGR